MAGDGQTTKASSLFSFDMTHNPETEANSVIVHGSSGVVSQLATTQFKICVGEAVISRSMSTFVCRIKDKGGFYY